MRSSDVLEGLRVETLLLQHREEPDPERSHLSASTTPPIMRRLVSELKLFQFEDV